MESAISLHKKIKVFIGSVFYENRKEWTLRSRLNILLRENNFDTWLWEENGRIEYEKTKLDWREIISQAISSCDIVVTFYKQSAGDDSRFFESPFFPTDYEISLAIKYGVSLRLYIINGVPRSEQLEGVLAVYANPTIIHSKPTFCVSETEFTDRIINDLQKIFPYKTEFTDKIIAVSDFYELSELELHVEVINALRHEGEFDLGHELIRKNADFMRFRPASKLEKALKAKCLAIWGNIYANYANYRRAIICTRQSIRLLLEIDFYAEAFGQIQALSGIYNMAGYPPANALNTYGFNSTKLYKHLADDFIDSRTSIYRSAGKFKLALETLELSRNLEKTPYSASKHAFLRGQSSDTSSLRQSRFLLEEDVLPWARREKKSVAYVLRDAALLAIKDHDLRSATIFLGEAYAISKSHGAFHAMGIIKKIERQLMLTNKTKYEPF